MDKRKPGNVGKLKELEIIKIIQLSAQGIPVGRKNLQLLGVI